jgi:hypothetical protein
MMAKTKIQETVSCSYGATIKLFSHTPYKMLEYCKKAPKAEPSILEDPAHLEDQDPFMTLASQYGLPAEMAIGASVLNEQTVDEEYYAYVMMQCSPPKTNTVQFWGVSGNVDGT